MRLKHLILFGCMAVGLATLSHADEGAPPRRLHVPRASAGEVDYGFSESRVYDGPDAYGDERGCGTCIPDRPRPFDPSTNYYCDPRFCDPPQLVDPVPQMRPSYPAPYPYPYPRRDLGGRRFYRPMAVEGCQIEKVAGEETYTLRDGEDRLWFVGTKANAEVMKSYYARPELAICPQESGDTARVRGI